MSYTLRFEARDDISPSQRQDAEKRFRHALEESLGDAALVAPIYGAYLRIVGIYGDDQANDALSDAEREILTQWQLAEAAAVTAAFGPNRYMDEPRFEVVV